jgi:hypothetical protein
MRLFRRPRPTDGGDWERWVHSLASDRDVEPTREHMTLVALQEAKRVRQVAARRRSLDATVARALAGRLPLDREPSDVPWHLLAVPPHGPLS